MMDAKVVVVTSLVGIVIIVGADIYWIVRFIYRSYKEFKRDERINAEISAELEQNAWRT